MQNNKPLKELLMLTSKKGFSMDLRYEIMITLNGNEEEKQKQVKEMKEIVQHCETEEEAMKAIKDYCSKTTTNHQ